jgi:hypothetical protein
VAELAKDLADSRRWTHRPRLIERHGCRAPRQPSTSAAAAQADRYVLARLIKIRSVAENAEGWIIDTGHAEAVRAVGPDREALGPNAAGGRPGDSRPRPPMSRNAVCGRGARPAGSDTALVRSPIV